MTILTNPVLIFVLYFSIPTATFAQAKPAVELEGAIAKEQVRGDLKAAIAAYQKIAAESSAPRAVRAKALLHLAGCYEKLGQQESRKVYERIVRNFGDQPAAAQARARLAALEQAGQTTGRAALTLRRIEMSVRNVGPEDTDGSRAVYLNDETRELIYGDLTGYKRKVIFKAKPGDLPGWAPSRDFSKVFLSFDMTANKHCAVIKTDGTGYRELPNVSAGNGCRTWSWDGLYILLCLDSINGVGGRLFKVSIADGKEYELVSLKAGSVTRAAFSPDGRYIAYELSMSSPVISRIFVVHADGREVQQVYEEHLTSGSPGYVEPFRLLDWSADGRFLAIASQRAGIGLLQLLPIREGRSTGSPIFVRYGDFEEGRTWMSGGGRMIVTLSKQPEYELWSLENFVPPAAEKKE